MSEKRIEKRKTKEYLKYTFSEMEKRDIAQEMARNIQQKEAKEDEKKAIVAQFKAELESIQRDVNQASQRLTNGYEHKNIDCEMWFHSPTEGFCQIFRIDNLEMVRERKMTQDELQLALDLGPK